MHKHIYIYIYIIRTRARSPRSSEQAPRHGSPPARARSSRLYYIVPYYILHIYIYICIIVIPIYIYICMHVAERLRLFLRRSGVGERSSFIIIYFMLVCFLSFCLRPVHLLRVVLLRVLESNFPGDPL